MEREIAAIFFARPPESSYDEALRYFLESYEGTLDFKTDHQNLANPNLIFTCCRIAQCYDKLKNKEAARQWAEKALSHPGRDDEVLEVSHKNAYNI